MPFYNKIIQAKLNNLNKISRVYLLNQKIISSLYILCLFKISVLRFIIRNQIKKFQFTKNRNLILKTTIPKKINNEINLHLFLKFI